MSDQRWCNHCKHFIFKIMLNGFHGVCDKDGRFVIIDDTCDNFERGQNEIYQKGKEADDVRNLAENNEVGEW